MASPKTLKVSVVDYTEAEAKKRIGWRLATEKDKENGRKSYKFIDEHGNRAEFVMDKNKTNRPFGLRLSEEYADRIFDQEWAGMKHNVSATGNGESMAWDRKGNVVSAAHRSVALILANIRRRRLINLGRKDLLDEKGINGEFVLPQQIIVEGVDPNAADTTDVGKKRDLSDILFRRHEFADKPESVQAELSKALSVAVRLVWLRTNGYQVGGGPKLPNPEAIRFLESNPLLHEAVLKVYDLNEKGKKWISKHVSLGYAAGLLYLQAYCESNTEKYHAGELDMARRPHGWKRAEEFWTIFKDISSGEGKSKGPVIHDLIELFRESETKGVKGQLKDRDAKCTAVVRTFSVWSGLDTSFTKGNNKLLTNLTKTVGSGASKSLVIVVDRLGGIDMTLEALQDMDLVASKEELKREEIEGWKVGDTSWVVAKDEQGNDVEPWFGKIMEFSEDGKTVFMQDTATDDEAWYPMEPKDLDKDYVPAE